MEFPCFVLTRKWTPIRPPAYRPLVLCLKLSLEGNHHPSIPTSKHERTKPYYRTSAVILVFQVIERKWTLIRPLTLESPCTLPTVESQRKPSSLVTNKHLWIRPHYRTTAVVLDSHTLLEQNWSLVRPPILQSSMTSAAFKSAPL